MPGEHHLLLNAGDSLLSSTKSAPTPPLNLRLELEEFSQLFDTPEHSTGLLRLRATLTQISPTGQQLIAQRSFTLQRPAPSPDAPGGVQALSEASEAVALEVGAWVAGVGR
jgi:cholesterol transport system auxiliary component